MSRINELKAISKFFFSKNATELENAYSILAQGDNEAPDVDCWEEVEFCFNKLFIGPKALLAPPFASLYLDQDKTKLMGATTELIRYLYEMVGLISPWRNKIPDDHLAIEIDALWKIESSLNEVQSEELEALHGFLLQHLRAWLPSFLNQINKLDNVHPVIMYVTKKLKHHIYAVEEKFYHMPVEEGGLL